MIPKCRSALSRPTLRQATLKGSPYMSLKGSAYMSLKGRPT